MEIAGRSKGEFQQKISDRMKATVKDPETGYQELSYPDRTLWAKNIEPEQEKGDENRKIRRIAPAKLDILRNKVGTIRMRISVLYKRNVVGKST